LWYSSIVPVSPPSSSTSARAGFQSTLWNEVQAAGTDDGSGGHQAMASLCRRYWPPVYAFVRRRGHERQDAQDLTQGFFEYLLEGALLHRADPNKGRFRSFLLGCLKMFISNEQAKARALKRGGSARFVPLDDASLGPEANELAIHLTPDRVFDRKWALAVIGQALQRLADEYSRAGMRKHFELLQPYLTGQGNEPLAQLGARLGKSPEATRVLLFRLRNRFRRLVRAIIGETVSNPADIESEMQFLERALRND
jgi:RNA polymerase sigma factor (sigma-70 family)